MVVGCNRLYWSKAFFSEKADHDDIKWYEMKENDIKDNYDIKKDVPWTALKI